MWENALVAYAKEQVRYRSLKDEADANRGGECYELYTKASLISSMYSTPALALSAEDQLVQSEKTISQNLVALYKALAAAGKQRRGLRRISRAPIATFSSQGYKI